MQTNFTSHILDDYFSEKCSLAEIKKYTPEQLSTIAYLAYHFLTQGRFSQAYNLFKGLSALDPKNDYYHRALGLVAYKMGDLTLAIEQFSIAIALEPQSAAALVNRAEILLLLGHANEARIDLVHALSPGKKNSYQLIQKINGLLRLLSREISAA